MTESHKGLTLSERSKITKDVLRVIAEDGWVIGPKAPASVRLREMYRDSDGPFQGVSRIIDSLVDEGLLTPSVDSKGRRTVGSAKGITTRGLEVLDELENSRRTYFEKHWSMWCLVGFGAITAIATAVTAVATVLD